MTYGCYGYIDSFGKLAATFYISDGWGYRVVHPREDVEIFYHEHEHHQPDTQSHGHDHNNNNHHEHNEHHEHHGVVTPWSKLPFPKDCAQFEDGGARPTRPTPSRPGRKLNKDKKLYF